jgi:hypothetical protein
MRICGVDESKLLGPRKRASGSPTTALGGLSFSAQRTGIASGVNLSWPFHGRRSCFVRHGSGLPLDCRLPSPYQGHQGRHCAPLASEIWCYPRGRGGPVQPLPHNQQRSAAARAPTAAAHRPARGLQDCSCWQWTGGSGEIC